MPGDPYAAGPLIPAFVPPFGCLKSSDNYGRLVQLRNLLGMRAMAGMISPLSP